MACDLVTGCTLPEGHPGFHETPDLDKIIIKIHRVLDECPLGIFQNRVLMSRTMNETDLVAWLERVYAIKESLRTIIDRQLQPPKDNTP